MRQFSIFCVDRNSTFSWSQSSFDDEIIVINPCNQTSRTSQSASVGCWCSSPLRYELDCCARRLCNHGTNDFDFLKIVTQNTQKVLSWIASQDDFFSGEDVCLLDLLLFFVNLLAMMITVTVHDTISIVKKTKYYVICDSNPRFSQSDLVYLVKKFHYNEYT